MTIIQLQNLRCSFFKVKAYLIYIHVHLYIYMHGGTHGVIYLYTLDYLLYTVHSYLYTHSHELQNVKHAVYVATRGTW